MWLKCLAVGHQDQMVRCSFYPLGFSELTTKQNLFQIFGHFFCYIFKLKSKNTQPSLECLLSNSKEK